MPYKFNHTRRLQSRDLATQVVEAKIASKALNHMTSLGRAEHEHIL